MSHAVFALFPNDRAAHEVIDEVEQDLELIADVEEVLTHHEGDHLRLESIVETDAVPGVRRGVLIGLAIGGVLGGVLAFWPGGPIMVGASVVIAVFALLGAMLGGFSGGLTGAAYVDHGLSQLLQDLRAGKVLVTFQMRHPETRQRILTISTQHGAKAVAKPLV